MFDTIESVENTYDYPLLEIVMTALQAKWCIPEETPETDFPPGFDRDSLFAFVIEEVDGGYVANIGFDVAPGSANTIGTPYECPLPTYREAFLEGARIVCETVTGSRELPFLVLGDELMMVSVTANGAPLMMRRPFPTQDD